MSVVAVEAGPTLTIATPAGAGAGARGVTVITEAEATTGDPGGSPPLADCKVLGALGWGR